MIRRLWSDLRKGPLGQREFRLLFSVGRRRSSAATISLTATLLVLLVHDVRTIERRAS